MVQNRQLWRRTVAKHHHSLVGHNSTCLNTTLSNYSKDAAPLLVQRLDGRQTYDYRRIKISFGADYGCCFVELGETRWIWLGMKGVKPSLLLHMSFASLDVIIGNEQLNVRMFWRVMAQVSCELVAPKESRPNEGILFFNIELSPLASPAFEAGRWAKDHYSTLLLNITATETSPVVVLCLQAVWVVSQPQQAAGEMPEELQVHRHRVSVCGVWRKGETHTHTHTGRVIVLVLTVCLPAQVWQIRVDVHMLNHDGNLMDAASIAAITALCHFRRPDVSIVGEEITVVSRYTHAGGVFLILIVFPLLLI